MLPLDGLKVLDFSKVLAGPLATQSLGDLGADVIKIEPIQVGDETRGWPPFRAPGLGAVYLSVNRNKRSIALDLTSEAGREVTRDLVREVDVVVESYGSGVAQRLGVDAPYLRAINDRLIHCSISGYGRSGPLRARPGYDVILQAFSGMMSLTGEEGGGHIRSPISPIDQVTGMNALTGILAALIERSKTGAWDHRRGQPVRYQPGLDALQHADLLGAGRRAQEMWDFARVIVPVRHFRCR